MYQTGRPAKIQNFKPAHAKALPCVRYVLARQPRFQVGYGLIIYYILRIAGLYFNDKRPQDLNAFDLSAADSVRDCAIASRIFPPPNHAVKRLYAAGKGSARGRFTPVFPFFHRKDYRILTFFSIVQQNSVHVNEKTNKYYRILHF